MTTKTENSPRVYVGHTLNTTPEASKALGSTLKTTATPKTSAPRALNYTKTKTIRS